MWGIPRQAQQVLVFLLVLLVFGGGMVYGRWQLAAGGEQAIVIEQGPARSGQETEERPAEFKVHVAGAVKRPGVYTFRNKSRVEDALALAEPLPEAALDGLNLAMYIRDEERIYVPYREISGGSASVGTGGGQAAGVRGKINLNLAGKDELMSLPGIGPALAQRIIDWRDNQGPFRQLEDLKKVSGIGDKRYEELHSLVTY